MTNIISIIVLFIVIIESCHCFIRNTNSNSKRRRNIINKVSIQSAELEILDRLQNKILSSGQPQLSNQILSSFDGSLNSIND